MLGRSRAFFSHPAAGAGDLPGVHRAGRAPAHRQDRDHLRRHDAIQDCDHGAGPGGRDRARLHQTIAHFPKGRGVVVCAVANMAEKARTRANNVFMGDLEKFIQISIRRCFIKRLTVFCIIFY